MRLAKVKSEVLSKALESPKEFSALHLYIAGFTGYQRTEDGCFISEIVECEGKPTLHIRLALEDYFFNEHPESEKLWNIAQETIGKKEIDLKVLKIVGL